MKLFSETETAKNELENELDHCLSFTYEFICEYRENSIRILPSRRKTSLTRVGFFHFIQFIKQVVIQTIFQKIQALYPHLEKVDKRPKSKSIS